jgi:hypothetical protein
VTQSLETIVASAREHFERGETKHSEIFYRQVLKGTDPPASAIARLARGEACVFFAREALSRGKYGTAVDWYYDAINADPRAVDYRVEMCRQALIPIGLFRDARMEAERATRIDPGHAEAWRMLSILLHKQGDVPGALAASSRQLELSPDDPFALLDRATIALDVADYDEVLRLCDLAAGTEAEANATHCRAMVAYRLGRHEEAIELYDRAIAAGCYDPAMARWNRSLALHSIGRYKEGWAEHEQRGVQVTDKNMARLMKRFTLPVWAGEPAWREGAEHPTRLHVHQEMGYGDVLAMARYLPLLVERGYDIQFEVAEPMVGLMQDSLKDILVMPRSPDYPAAMGIRPFDYHVPMLSLPHLFRTDIDTVPWRGPYLKANQTLVAKYREQVPEGAVGLCWSSGIREDGVWMSEYGRRKSMHFNQLAPITSARLIGGGNRRKFISLQVGPERKQIRSSGMGGGDTNGILDVLPTKPTWADTAAVIECLDLVITVDTSVAHLAGAMGKSVWVMVAEHAASWHWMTERAVGNSSPWYPSARLFRQKKTKEWGETVERVARELKG